MQTQAQSTFSSGQLSQSVSVLSLGLPPSSSQPGALSHAMPGGISHVTPIGTAHAVPGAVSHAMSGGITHALPLASCASPNFTLHSACFDSGHGLAKVKLADLLPEDGPPSAIYKRAVEDLSSCLSRQGVALLELSAEDAALVRCALESATLYFRTRAQASTSVPPRGSVGWSKTSGYVFSGSRDMYYYRAGRNPRGIDDTDPPPPCMSDVFRCLGKAARITLGAICRHLRLRSDAFYSLLDDCPLPDDSTSSSVLVATHFHEPVSNLRSPSGSESCLQEFEKGLVTLIASDSPGLQVFDSNGQFYPADMGLRAGELLVITGKCLQHVTAGVRRACAYRVAPPSSCSGPTFTGRTSLTFRLMPRASETLDGSTMVDAGHAVSDIFGPVPVSKFLEGMNSAESMLGNRAGGPLLQAYKPPLKAEPSLRSLLSDPLTGDLLDDAFTALTCGHSFGGGSFKRLKETQRCSVCGVAVNFERLIPNHALRAAATAFKREENRKQFHVQSRKRKRELNENGEKVRRFKEFPGSPTSHEMGRYIKGVQYPFNVNEKVLIKGNKRTPEKFVGREAVVTSKCLNGWYLLRTLDNGESVRLQYRSLQACAQDHNGVNTDSVPQQSSMDNGESNHLQYQSLQACAPDHNGMNTQAVQQQSSLDNGESIHLQYRCLQTCASDPNGVNTEAVHQQSSSQMNG